MAPDFGAVINILTVAVLEIPMATREASRQRMSLTERMRLRYQATARTEMIEDVGTLAEHQASNRARQNDRGLVEKLMEKGNMNTRQGRRRCGDVGPSGEICARWTGHEGEHCGSVPLHFYTRQRVYWPVVRTAGDSKPIVLSRREDGEDETTS